MREPRSRKGSHSAGKLRRVSPPRIVYGDERPSTVTCGTMRSSESSPSFCGDDEDFMPHVVSSWSGTQVVHQWALRPAATKGLRTDSSRIRHTPGPDAWGTRAASQWRGRLHEPKPRPDRTQVQWVAQRNAIPEHGEAATGPLALERKADGARRGKARPPSPWNSRFVHGSPLMQPERRWPDASSSFVPLPKQRHRYGLSPHMLG